MARYVALLRGINVGGKNVIRMADLAACFEANGFDDVSTYIQSGNVLFSASGPVAALAHRIESMLTDAFGYEASLVVRNRDQMRAIVASAPAGFGAAPDRYRYDVIFLMPPLTARAAMVEVSTREEVDAVAPGPGVMYFSRLIARATQSRMGKIAATPIYPRITIRNWNTTTTLLRMMEGDR